MRRRRGSGTGGGWVRSLLYVSSVKLLFVDQVLLRGRHMGFRVRNCSFRSRVKELPPSAEGGEE